MRGGFRVEIMKRFSVLGRPGSDLLFQVLRLSTIGAGEFNGRVRDGIGFGLPAVTTRPAKDGLRKTEDRRRTTDVRISSPLVSAKQADFICPLSSVVGRPMGNEDESVQVNRAISTGKLNALLRLHTRPIDVVVYYGSRGRTRFEVGFPLRCLQRLSRPYIATQHCGWRHNCSTRGTSIPVLSY
jgi:hypothetical protein